MINYSEQRLTKLTKAFFVSQDLTPFPDATVVPEIRTLQGRPDLVLLMHHGADIRPKRVKAAGLAMTSLTAASILACLHYKKRINVEDIYARVHATPRSVRKALDILANANLITDVSGKLSQTELLSSLAVPIWAIEVKRRISRRAVFQAQQYRSFASRSIISCWGDDSPFESPVPTTLSRLGIISITYDGTVRLVRRGRSTRPRNLIAYYYALGSAYARRSVSHSGFALQ